MKKILTLSLISAITLIISAGCSSKSTAMGAHIGEYDESTVKTAIYIGDTKTEKAISAIKKAAKKTGWRVTEFKSDSVIVEKVVDDETISRTIKVHNKHISGDHAASRSEFYELREAIVEVLQEKKEDSH